MQGSLSSHAVLLLQPGVKSAMLLGSIFDAPLIVACYHGNSSQSAAAYLAHQGFSEVYSLDGGFELWRATYPNETAQSTAE